MSNWLILGVLAIAVTVALFFGINVLEATDWMKASQSHAAIGVLIIIGGLAVLNVAIMVGIGICATLNRE